MNSSGEQANDSSAGHSISPDGQHVVFGSIATNLVDNDSNGYRDIFVHNRQTGNTKRASVDSSGVQSNNDSHSAVLSSGGQVVALYSYASNLVPNDTNGQPDIFIRIDEGSFYVIPNAQGGISIIYLE